MVFLLWQPISGLDRVFNEGLHPQLEPMMTVSLCSSQQWAEMHADMHLDTVKCC